jgi:hypothetical protein
LNERTLLGYFEGKVDASRLAADLKGSRNATGEVSRYSISDMDEEFKVRAFHLEKLCDSFLAGDLSAEDLRIIGFALVASENFVWDEEDEEVVSCVANEWAVPEINYPIDDENVRRWKSLLAMPGGAAEFSRHLTR